MATTTLGAGLPRVVPMTGEQYRAHRALGRAEKQLIHAIVWDLDPAVIARRQKTVNKWTSAWRKACQAAPSHGETL